MPVSTRGTLTEKGKLAQQFLPIFNLTFLVLGVGTLEPNVRDDEEDEESTETKSGAWKQLLTDDTPSSLKPWKELLRPPVSEQVLTPFQSVPIRNLITLSPHLTSISLYCFQYLHSGSTRPISPRYSLDLVVHFPCLLLRTLFRSYLRPALDPRRT